MQLRGCGMHRSMAVPNTDVPRETGFAFTLSMCNTLTYQVADAGQILNRALCGLSGNKHLYHPPHTCAEERARSSASPCGQVLPQKCHCPAAFRLLYRHCASRASVYSASVRRRSGFWNISVAPGQRRRRVIEEPLVSNRRHCRGLSIMLDKLLKAS